MSKPESKSEAGFYTAMIIIFSFVATVIILLALASTRNFIIKHIDERIQQCQQSK